MVMFLKEKKKDTNDLRAIKVIDIAKIQQNLLYQYDIFDMENQLQLCVDGFVKEFEIMKICGNKNNNSVKCYEYFHTKKEFVIVMELCDMNLSEYLMDKIKKDKNCFKAEEILEIISPLNKSFEIMKKNNIIHRDLKLENILIKFNDKQNKDFTIKL